MLIHFGEWKPDNAIIGNDTLCKAHNVYADGTSFSPLKEMVSFSAPLKYKPLGSASFIDRDGNVITVAGDEKNLYVSRGFNWDVISEVEDGYSALGQIWRFELWGDYILATDYNDKIQAWKIGSVETFKAMSETAPRCKDFRIVNEFLVLINTVDEYDQARPNRVWWSPIGDPFSVWEPNQTTMCDYQDIQVGSYCVGIVGGSFGTILMRSALVRMNFVGSPIAFSFETVETDKGCVGQEAFCTDGSDIFYVAQDGFYVWNGAQSVPLGSDKVDKWFFENSEIKASNLVISVFDKVRKVVLFGYPGKGEFEKPSKILVYGILAKKWTTADCVVTHFTQFLSQGYDLEQLDEVSESIDLLPFSLDSNYYKGGIPSVGGFGTDKKFYFEGEMSLNGEIITGDIILKSNEQRSYTQRIRPIVDGGEAHTLSICNKQSVFDENNFGRSCQLTPIGDFTERKAGRYHRFDFTFKGNWARARAFEVTLAQEGLR